MRRFRRVAIWVGTVLGVYALAMVGLAYRYVHPGRKSVTRPEFVQEADYAGQPAWQAVPQDPKAIVLFAHGYGGTRMHWNNVMPLLAKQRIASVAIAMPGQEQSTIAGVGFGGKESEVLRKVARELRSKFPVAKLYVYGVSLGGASAWIAAGTEPELFDGVITEAAYSHLEPASRRYLSLAMPTAAPVMEPIILLGPKIANIDPSRLNPIDFAARYRGPAIVIHDEDDTLATRSVSESLAAASGAELVVISGAAHARAIDVDANRVAEVIARLLEKRNVKSNVTTDFGSNRIHKKTPARRG